MPIEIRMPALSPTMTEGNLARWLKREGDAVSAGDVIAEIETDKATMEIEAVEEGKLGKILIADGTEGVAVNTPIALLLEEGEEASALAGFPSGGGGETAAPTEAEVEPPVAPASSAPPVTRTEAAVAATPTVAKAGNGADRGGRIFASPLARRMAEQAGIDLGRLQGSGPHGRIIKVDIERAIRKGVTAKAAPAAAPAPAAARPEAPAARAPSPMPAAPPPAAAYTEQPLSNMRKVIARRLTEAKQTIPHFYLSMDCEIEALLKLRGELNAREGADYKLSVNDFVIKAAALALRKVPKANASFGGDRIYQYHDIDIGVAVAIEDGLVTPVIRRADQKGLAAISREMRDLSARARDPGGMKLKPEEYQGGSLSVSNLGMYGVRDFQAVINPPQACILAVGTGERRPVIKEGAVASATVMTVTLSIDHRVVDGALGAQLLQAFKGYIEDPLAMLLWSASMATKPAELYDEDFYAWTQEQAKALRTHFRGDNRIDVEHLAEEVEDLGGSELQAVESFVEQIIAHLLKLDYSGQDAPRPHWRAEVLNFRRSVQRKISPTIRQKVESELDELYEGGRQIAAIGALPHEPDLARRLPKTCPYDWDTIWRRDVMAEAGFDLSEGGEGAKKRRRKRGA